MNIQFKDGSTQEVDLNDGAAVKAAIMAMYAPTPEDFVVLNALLTNMESCAVEGERKRIKDLKDVIKKYNDENKTKRIDNIEP